MLKAIKSVTLKTKFIVLLVGIIAACLCVNLIWSSHDSEAQTERELLQQVRALSANMDAIWDFMNINQDLINYDKQGNYEFKGLQCSIAGRSIGALFSQKTDYETRYVCLTPRNDSNEPDTFEAEGLTAFAENPEQVEYYGIAYSGENQVFRYLAPMVLEESCLDCHGYPKGEIDESGYPKEGLSEGDAYGAISLIIPMGTYEDAAKENTFKNVIFSVLLITACSAVIYIALTTLVTKPFARIRKTVGEIESGDLSVRLQFDNSSSEISDLSRGFNQMTEKLENLYGSLEDQVLDRTEALKQANSVLEDQRKDLERMNNQLRDDNRYKSDFLAMMSHELRTPLAATMSFSEILKEKSRAQSEEEIRLWNEIEVNNRTLLSIINNILEMARIDAGKETLHLELFDIGDMVEILKITIEPLALQKNIGINYGIASNIPLFMADAEKLRRITENLLSNAVKFTPCGGSISITIEFNPSSNSITLIVSDTGIGISKKDQAFIFERFIQADSSSSRSYGGSGLGLALAKELTEMHGGRISLVSKPNEGSTFTVVIPTNLNDLANG